MFTLKHNLVALLLAAAIPTVMTVAIAQPNADQPAPRAPDFETGGEESILPTDVVRFGFDSTAIDDVDRKQLAAAAAWLHEHPGYNLVVEAHTDGVGARTYNADLADRRASMVRATLRVYGADPNRVIKVICGEGRSLGVSNAADRRVILYATGLDFHGLVEQSPEPCYPVVI